MLELIKGLKKSNEQGKELTYANLIKENEELKDESYRWMETSGYMEHLYNESKNENEILKEKIKSKDELLFNTTQENARMENKINDLKTENQTLEERLEGLEEEFEINERLDTDKQLDEDYYQTKELDYGLLSKTIDKITDERNTYKEVINIMCDKFDISHDSVLNIIDDISQNKSIEKERV